ncbi:MAG TPA: hypothetical protein VG674_01350 [Amycolatopsis sp.]|nr:hypothetical protein [Amycolatopsis sp.]
MSKSLNETDKPETPRSSAQLTAPKNIGAQACPDTTQAGAILEVDQVVDLALGDPDHPRAT